MENKEKQAKDILKRYKQEHIINWIDKAEEETKQEIINQVLTIDFEELKTLYDKTQMERAKKQSKIQPIVAIDKERMNKEDRDIYQNLGEDVLRRGKFAVVTMAGGQGTRLRT